MANNTKKPRKGTKPKPEKAKKASAPASEVTETTKPEPCRALVLYRRPGRPTSFTPELGLQICCRIAEGESLRTICLDDAMPNKATVLRWLMLGKAAAEGSVLRQFSDHYTRAREIQAHLLADEIFDIADDGTNDWMEVHRRDGSTEIVLDHEHVQRSRLRVEARKWFLSKVLPKVYGEKVSHEVSSPDGGPVQVQVQTIPKFESAQEFARWVQEQQLLRQSQAA